MGQTLSAQSVAWQQFSEEYGECRTLGRRVLTELWRCTGAMHRDMDTRPLLHACGVADDGAERQGAFGAIGSA